TILQQLRAVGRRIELIEGPRGSAPELRNAAVARTHSNWVLFLDDDIVLSDVYLDELRNLLGDPGDATIFQGSASQCINRNNWLARSEQRLSEARLRRWSRGVFLDVCDARNLLMAT